MRICHFDTLTQRPTEMPTRREVWRGLAALGLLSALGSTQVRAKTRRKTVKLNQFGCVNVGGKCRGKDSKCCSGICQGKKPKKGEKDKSRCIAHDTGGCPTGHDACVALDIDCTTSAGSLGECGTTTGNAGYCFNIAQLNGSCRRDTDCQAALGASAACIHCPSNGQTLCVGFQNM